MEDNGINKIDHTDLISAKKIHVIFQRSYRIEAEIIGVEDFPPLHRTIDDFQTSDTQFFGFMKNEVLAAVAEIRVDERQLEIFQLWRPRQRINLP